MAQELLTTFSDDLHGVLLHPSAIAGSYKIYVNDQLLFDRKASGGFPEIKQLKQAARDLVNPSKSLGHSDRDGTTTSPS